MAVSNILIADDRAIIRRGLALMISDASDLTPEEVPSVEDLFDRLRTQAIEVVILGDAFAQDVDIVRRIKGDFPDVAILIFRCQSDDVAAMRALRAGAAGYIEAVNSPEDLLGAIRRLQAGGTYLSQVIAEKIATELARGYEGERAHEKLSRRELEVFQLLGAGKSVGEIARKLKISVKTVSTHRTRILEKTGMRNNADIIRYTILNHIHS